MLVLVFGVGLLVFWVGGRILAAIDWCVCFGDLSVDERGINRKFTPLRMGMDTGLILLRYVLLLPIYALHNLHTYNLDM